MSLDLSRAEQFSRRLAALIAEAEDRQSKIAHLDGMVDTVDRVKDAQARAQFTQVREGLTRELRAIEETACELSRARDLGTAREMLHAVTSRLAAARNEAAALAANLAEFEFQVAAEPQGLQSPEFDRAEFEAQLTRQRARVALRAKLAHDALPAAMVLLGVGA
jgi:hypothetical protein